MPLSLQDMTRLWIDLPSEMFIIVGPEDQGIEHLILGRAAVRDLAVRVGVKRVEPRIVEMGDGFNRRPGRQWITDRIGQLPVENANPLCSPRSDRLRRRCHFQLNGVD